MIEQPLQYRRYKESFFRRRTVVYRMLRTKAADIASANTLTKRRADTYSAATVRLAGSDELMKLHQAGRITHRFVPRIRAGDSKSTRLNPPSDYPFATGLVVQCQMNAAIPE